MGCCCSKGKEPKKDSNPSPVLQSDLKPNPPPPVIAPPAQLKPPDEANKAKPVLPKDPPKDPPNDPKPIEKPPPKPIPILAQQEEEVPFETVMAQKQMKTYKSDHVTITTVYDEKDIVKLERTPRGTIKKSVHFMCPVCLNYFNLILISSCCKHYLCHQCALNLLNSSRSVEVRCPQCNKDPLILTDVDPAKSVKVYSDTFIPNRITKSGEKKEAEVYMEDLDVRDSPRVSEDPENRI